MAQFQGEEVAIFLRCKILRNNNKGESQTQQYYQNLIVFSQHLAIEYVEGGSLSEYMKLNLDEETISSIMRSLFSAIEYLHSKQIIH